MIDKHGEVLVADLKHYYGVDLRDLFRAEWPLTPRYVLSLIRYLPVGSAFVAEQRGGQQFRDWDADRYMNVSIVDSLRAIQWMYLVSHIDTKKVKAPPSPEPFPTPSKSGERKKPAPKPGSFAAIAGSMLAAQKRRKGLS